MHSLYVKISAAALVAAVGILALYPAAGTAQSTITVSPSQVRSATPLSPNAMFELPVYTITNGSDHAMAMTVSIEDTSEPGRGVVPHEWFSVEPTELVVPGGGQGTVSVALSVPEDARPGAYGSWLRFHGVREGATGIATAGALRVPFTFDVREPGMDLRLLLWIATGVAGVASVAAGGYAFTKGRRAAA